MIDVREVGARIKDSLQHRGVIGTIQVFIRSVFHPVLGDQRVIHYRERMFDRKFGVNTAGIISHEDMKYDGPSAAQANFYQAAQPHLFEEAVSGLKIDYSGYTFVDFGCGKGKVLLLASSFPFKKIIGLELSSELSKIAEDNLKNYKNKKQQCRTLEILCIDAVEFKLPPAPLVCFFYNPFKETLMSRVLKNIEESLSEHPRDLIIVYLYPELDHVFRDKNFLVNTRRKGWCCVYRSAPAVLNVTTPT